MKYLIVALLAITVAVQPAEPMETDGLLQKLLSLLEKKEEMSSIDRLRRDVLNLHHKAEAYLKKRGELNAPAAAFAEYVNKIAKRMNHEAVQAKADDVCPGSALTNAKKFINGEADLNTGLCDTVEDTKYIVAVALMHFNDDDHPSMDIEPEVCVNASGTLYDYCEHFWLIAEEPQP